MGKSSNLPAKMYSVGEPTELRLSFEGEGSASKYIDIGLALSTVNQRAYRSGLYYYVSSIEFYDNDNGMIDVHTLPNTYGIKNAWVRAFEKYMEMNRLAGDIPRGKWHDFRVYMSELHKAAGSWNPSLHGVNGASATLACDETDLYSQLISADDDGDTVQQADNFYLHMLGPHDGASGNWVSVGLVDSYDAARKNTLNPLVGDPDLDITEALADPINNLFDFSSEEQVNDIMSQIDVMGDVPPYDTDQMNGAGTSSMQHQARMVCSSGINRVAKSGGFCAPLGLICIDPMTSGSDSHAMSSTNNWRVVISLAPGTYNGCHAERVI